MCKLFSLKTHPTNFHKFSNIKFFSTSTKVLSVVYNQYFLLQTTATVSEIYSKSEERITSGFSVKVLTRCTGAKDDLYQDIMKVKLQSGSRTLHLVFPVAVSLKKKKFIFTLSISLMHQRGTVSIVVSLLRSRSSRNALLLLVGRKAWRATQLLIPVLIWTITVTLVWGLLHTSC